VGPKKTKSRKITKGNLDFEANYYIIHTMSPLHVQLRNLEDTGWLKFGEPLQPGEAPSSISNNPPDGEREIVFFGCEPDGLSSVIRKTISARETVSEGTRVFSSSVFDEIKRLRVGDKPYVLDVITDRGDEATIRFTHKER
jgi:hypothetical protein